MFNTIKLILGMIASISFHSRGSSNENIWLIGERKAEAKDNGFHLFKYIRIKHPEEKLYYVIDGGSPQKHRVEQYGQVINHNSLQHYIAFFRATILIMPFERSTFPNSSIIWYWYRLKLLRKKTAFLQHGVTKEKQDHYAYNNRFKFDLFVCSAKEEHEFVCSELNYPKSVAKCLGMARYDALIDTHKSNKIFYMPTWRAWMVNYGEREFQESDYYKGISSLLESNELMQLLENFDGEMVVYLHDAFQKNFGGLIKSKNRRVTIAEVGKHDVQELLKDSAVMITDFSSAVFDFAYMGKPVVYYQFDREDYYSKHFIEGYFDYIEHGFGPVCESPRAVIQSLEEIFASNKEGALYKSRCQSFFPINDRKNCLRNYEAIKSL